MKKNLFFLVLFCILLLISFWRQKSNQNKATKSRIALGTFVEISLKGNQENLDAIIDSCFDIISNLENKLSYQKSESALNLINLHEKAEMFPELYFLLNYSKKIYNLSKRKFDPTIGALIDIWDFEEKRVPSSKMIKKTKEVCGLDKIRYDSATIIKPKELKIHLGGIAKGYIVQEIYNYLQRYDISDGYINAGGDLLIFGETPKKIGITHPRQKDVLIDTVEIANGAIVTSGDYERFFVQGGKRYHHIIDPTTGYPSTECISITVIDTSILRADALATAYFMMPIDETIQSANENNLALLVYYLDNGILKSKESETFKNYRMKND